MPAKLLIPDSDRTSAFAPALGEQYDTLEVAALRMADNQVTAQRPNNDVSFWGYRLSLGYVVTAVLDGNVIGTKAYHAYLVVPDELTRLVRDTVRRLSDGSTLPMSPDLRALAERAAADAMSRRDEDVDSWARRLAEAVGDADY